MLTDEKIKEIVERDAYSLIIDRLVQKYIEEDREQGLYDLFNERYDYLRERAKEKYKTLSKKSIEKAKEKILNHIINYRNDKTERLPARHNKGVENINQEWE